MGFSLVTGPALEPLSVSEVRAHLQIGFDGVLDPPGAPLAALISPAVAGNVDNGVHRYRATFVNADGESDAGEISTVVTVADKTVNGKVSLTSIPLAPSTAAVTSRKLYRTKAAGTVYYLLATIADNTTEVYTDNTADASLGSQVGVDDVIAGYITAARDHVEKYCERPVIAQDWKLTLDEFPYASGGSRYPQLAASSFRRRSTYQEDVIDLLPSLISVASVSYVDADGNTQTLATTEYDVDTLAFPGRIVLKYGKFWPVTRDQRNAVTITFRAGYGEDVSSVPGSVKSAMKLLIGDWYRMQLGTSKVDPMSATNRAVEALLAAERYLVAA